MSVSLARRAEAEREIRRRQRMRIEAAGLMNAISDDMTFLAWCQKLADDGMKVDGNQKGLTGSDSMPLRCGPRNRTCRWQGQAGEKSTLSPPSSNNPPSFLG
jgi:hypothetical protein